jgi:hypothetical protein
VGRVLAATFVRCPYQTRCSCNDTLKIFTEPCPLGIPMIAARAWNVVLGYED